MATAAPTQTSSNRQKRSECGRVALKVLCASAPAFGHAIPVLRVAATLQQAGYEVLAVAEDGDIGSLFGRHGIPTTSTPKAPLLEQQVRLYQSLLESYRPDITVCDWNEQLWWALRAWRPQCRMSIMRCECLFGYQRRNPLLPDKFLFDSKKDIAWMNEMAAAIGFPGVGDLRDIHESELIVIPSVPQLDPLPDGVSKMYPSSSFIYSGPLLLPPASHSLAPSLEDWVGKWRAEGVPIVLVTLGTVWGAKVYRLLADCLEGAGFALLMIVPDEEERAELHTRSDEWLYVTGFTDLTALAAKADIVLHHCGHATLQTVLLAGKPSVVLPSGEFDREDNALRMEDLSCGRFLGHDFFRSGFRTAAFVRVITEVLCDQRIREGVSKLSIALCSYISACGPGGILRELKTRGL